MPGARYFVTICLRERAAGLTDEPCSSAIRDAWERAAPEAETLGALIMPDHLHWLFVLGRRLTLSQIIARFKSHTRPALATGGLSWETNYWDRRLRPEDGTESFGAYIYLNPYRAGLIPYTQPWPHGYWPKPGAFLFFDALGPSGEPPANWRSEKPAGWSSEPSPRRYRPPRSAIACDGAPSAS